MEKLASVPFAMMVTEYRNRFLQLARYAPGDVAADGDKQEHIREGLDDHIQYALLNHHFDDFNELVDAALNTEHKAGRWRTRRGRWLPLHPLATCGLGTSTLSSSSTRRVRPSRTSRAVAFSL